MADSRLPASPQGTVSGTDDRDRPVEILPRLHGVEIKDEDRDLALILAEYVFPGLTHIDQIDDGRKAWWIVVATRLLSGDKAIIRYVEAFSTILQPSVDAQVNDTLRKGAAEELERQEREAREREIHEANLLRMAQQETLDREQWELKKKEREKKLELEEKERTTRLRLEKEERETARRNRDRRDKLFMGVAAITFVCAFAAFIIGVISGEPLILGGSGVTGVAALVTILKLLSYENQTPPPGGASDPDAS